MHPRIFLIGFMGSGKSTAGAELARAIGYEFVDMDRVIEETAGMTIPGIFREHGEAVFRKWERDILNEICTRERVVVSTGGGAPCHGNMMQIMNENGATVYIKMPAAALKERLVRSKTERPLIKGKSDSQLMRFIEELLAVREPYYNQAKYTVNGVDLEVSVLAGLLSE